MIEIALLLATEAIVFALAAVAVRLQLSLFGGFDFAVATGILVAAESFATLSRVGGGSTPGRIALAVAGAGLVTTAFTVLWNHSVERLWKGRATLGSHLLVFSLGISTAASGFVVVIRGPGLHQPMWQLPPMHPFGVNFGAPTLFACLGGGICLFGTWLWTHTRAGFALQLFAQDQQFAREIGVERRHVLTEAGVVLGMLSSVIGCYYALASGSTPEIGTTVFLIGAGASLLFSTSDLMASVRGGAVLGCAYVLVQLVFAPAVATSVVFFAVLVLLLARGSTRLLQQVR